MDYPMINAETIRAAKKGETEAWNTILRHYRPYISASCKKSYSDKYGNICTVVDEDMVQQIESILMFKTIMKFDINRPSREMLER